MSGPQHVLELAGPRAAVLYGVSGVHKDCYSCLRTFSLRHACMTQQRCISAFCGRAAVPYKA